MCSVKCFNISVDIKLTPKLAIASRRRGDQIRGPSFLSMGYKPRSFEMCLGFDWSQQKVKTPKTIAV